MRIAHFSDPHLLSMKGTRLRAFLNKRWLGGLNLIANRAREHSSAVFDAMVADINALGVEQVLCTGDITNVALPSEFEFARAAFDRLTRGHQHTAVIPGNHDAYVAAGEPLFREHFAPYARGDSEWAWPDGDPWPMVRLRGRLAIIGLTTSRPTPWFTAWGTVGAKQADRLGQVLSDPRLAGHFRLVAIHHPPAGRCAAHRRHGLKDRHLFADAIAAGGAELILHGHEHRDLRADLPGPDGRAIPVRGIQSATYAGARPTLLARYRIYTLDDGTGGRPAAAAEQLRVWDPNSGCFQEDHPSGARRHSIRETDLAPQPE